MNAEEAKELFAKLSESTVEQQVAFFAAPLKETDLPALLLGFRAAILGRASTFELSSPALDLCGTGGDKKNTINISTLCACVAASFGIPVCKHGNIGASSSIGSTDFLNLLGVPLPKNPEEASNFFEKNKLVFLHAPFFHPDLKKFSEARKMFGRPTVFNMLGPLCNPASPTHHFAGTFPISTYHHYQSIVSLLPTKYLVVHARDGYDEISGTGAFLVGDGKAQIEYDIRDFLKGPISADRLCIGTESEESRVSTSIGLLSGSGDPEVTQVLALNTAFAASLFYGEKDLKYLFSSICDHIKTGAPFTTLKTITQHS